MQDNNDLFKKPKIDSENLVEENEFKTKIFENNLEDLSKKNNDNSFSDLYGCENPSEIKTEEKNISANKKIKSKKNKKGLPVIAKVLIMLIISISLASVIILAAIDVLGITFNNDLSAEVIIKQGYSTEQIANELHEKGVIKYPILFRLYSKFMGADGSYQFGMYDIKDSQGYSSIIKSLKNPGESGEVVKVTIPEGYSVRKIADLMQQKGICTKEQFISAVKNAEFQYDFIKEIPSESVYYNLEGYLYPDTYQLFADSDGKNGEECAKKAVNKMLAQMDKVITDDVKSAAKKKGYTVHQILTMASVVELEASGYPGDMKKVAQVFYNRLRWTDEPAMLGSTPTSDYPDSRYDTNKHEGLPPGPLCSPSKEAVEAALNPDTSVKANYFVTDKNMKFYYTNSFDEHNELIERLKSEGLWN